LTFAGAIAVAYGLWLAYPPMAFIFGGSAAAVFGVLVAWSQQKAKK